MERRKGFEVRPLAIVTLPTAKPITILQSKTEDFGRNDVTVVAPPNGPSGDSQNSTAIAGPDHSLSQGSGCNHMSPQFTARSSSSSAPGLDFYMSPDEETPLPDLGRGDPSSLRSSMTLSLKMMISSSSAMENGQDVMPDVPVIMATGGYDRKIRLWDFKTGVNYRSIKNQGSQVNKLMITGNKLFIAAAGNPDIHLYELNTMRNEPVISYHGHNDNVTSLDFHRSGNWMVSSSEDKTVRFWDIRDPSNGHQFLCPDPVNSVKLHPNEVEIFCAGEQGVIRVMDLRRNLCSVQLQTDMIGLKAPRSTAIKSLDIKWDGSLLVAANANGMCFVWSLRSRNQVNTEFELFTRIQAHDTYITKCCFSPMLSARNLLATSSADKTLKLWKVGLKTVTLDRTLMGHQKWVWDCAFSRDGGNLLSSSTDTMTRLWQVSTGNILQTYQVTEQNPSAMNCCAFNDSNPT